MFQKQTCYILPFTSIKRLKQNSTVLYQKQSNVRTLMTSVTTSLTPKTSLLIINTGTSYVFNYKEILVSTCFKLVKRLKMYGNTGTDLRDVQKQHV